MQCPYCGGDSSVVDSRTTADAVRRRRLCGSCKRRFTTYERLAAPNIKVVKRSGGSEPFDSQKIVRVLMRVGRDRPNLEESDILRLAYSIEAELVDGRARSIHSGELLRMLLSRLRDVDRVAHDRLAGDYLDESGQLRTDGKGDVRRFALNVDPNEGDNQLESDSKLRDNIENEKIEIRGAGDTDYAAGIGDQTNFDWILAAFLAMFLVVEQLLAYSASYHPARGAVG